MRRVPKGYKRSDAGTVLDAIRDHPGIIQRDLARRTGLGEGLVRGHLRQLIVERRVRVVETDIGKKTYYTTPEQPSEPRYQA